MIELKQKIHTMPQDDICCKLVLFKNKTLYSKVNLVATINKRQHF